MRGLLVIAGACLCAAEQLAARVVDAAAATGSPPPCSQTAFPVPNGDFEDGTFGSWTAFSSGQNTAQVVSAGGGAEGQYAAQLSHGGSFSSQGPRITHNTMYFCREAFYQLAFDYKVATANENCYLTMYPLSTLPASASTFSVALSATDWTTGSLNFSTQGAGAMGIQAQVSCNTNGAPGVVLLDNFVVTPAAGSVENGGCPRQMFAQNGGFETGDIERWEVSPRTKNVNTSVVSPGRGPNSKYAFQADFNIVEQTVSEFVLRRDVSSYCVGYNYTLSWAYRFAGYDAVHHPDFCQLQFFDMECTTDASGTYLFTFPPESAWTHVNVTCESQENAVHSLSFAVVCGVATVPPKYNHTQFSFEFDNLVVALAPPQP